MPLIVRSNRGPLFTRARATRTGLRAVASLSMCLAVGLGNWHLAARDGRQQASPAPAPQAAAPKGCRVTGTVTMTTQAGTQARPARGGQAAAGESTPDAAGMTAMPLPGATVVVRQGARLIVATATDIQGRFTIVFTPQQTFGVSAELTGFASVEKNITLAALPCDTTLDFVLGLVPRDRPLPNLATAAQAAAVPGGDGAGT